MMLPLVCVANLLVFCLSSSAAELGRQESPSEAIEDFEAVVAVEDTIVDKNEDAANEAGDFDGFEYSRDLRNAAAGKAAMDPEKVYTAQAMLPVGEMLVLATASGCTLLRDPEEETPGKVEALEFSFRIADLEDCAKVTESIVNSLQEEIVAEWANLGGGSVDGGIASSTRLHDIGMRRGNRSSETTSADTSEFTLGIQDLANAFLATNLEMKVIPTTADGVVVMHFDIADNTSAREITQMLSNVDPDKLKELGEAIKEANDKIMNASPEEMQKMEEELKVLLERNNEEARQRVENGKSVLEELSTEGIAEIECSSLALEDCGAVSKCGMVKLNGEKVCAVAPNTIFLLMETGCGLQSKAGLMSVVRDLVGSGLMTEATHQTLRESFDLGKICNAIVHTYMSANIAETEHHEAKRSFEL
ncbi:signal peptide containing protein [Babesia caballi]|uniref:Signal peptide containing protein n=1 Tax=Babesia caballi TaxID=5871 RepID=A0AAV4M0L9_BABCB|nr:signal peptide containing protein [Babesia caballi]